MVSDAEAHRSEDAQLRELVDARNELDSVTYQVQRRLEQAGDAVPEHDRARAEMLINDARTALDEQAPIDRLRSLTARAAPDGPGPERVCPERGRRRRHR